MIKSWNKDDRRVESPNAQSDIVSSDEEIAQEGAAKEPRLFKKATEEELASIFLKLSASQMRK